MAVCSIRPARSQADLASGSSASPWCPKAVARFEFTSPQQFQNDHDRRNLVLGIGTLDVIHVPAAQSELLLLLQRFVELTAQEVDLVVQRLRLVIIADGHNAIELPSHEE